MVRRRASEEGVSGGQAQAERLRQLATSAAVAGIPGPGRWLVVSYLPTALFSLKTSLATSSVGKTLIVPTPYAIKMALVDAAFRAGVPDEECAIFLRALAGLRLRIAAPDAAVVTHTFVKVRQEARSPDRKKEQTEQEYWESLVQKLLSLYPGLPETSYQGSTITELRRWIDAGYDGSIAYRELAHHHGIWRWAFDLSTVDDATATLVVRLAPYVSYVGKRGSFVQFTGMTRTDELDEAYTTVPDAGEPWPVTGQIAPLDDFGPEATLDVLSSFSSRQARRDRHRMFVHTVIPLGATNTGPGFTEYRRQ